MTASQLSHLPELVQYNLLDVPRDVQYCPHWPVFFTFFKPLEEVLAPAFRVAVRARVAEYGLEDSNLPCGFVACGFVFWWRIMSMTSRCRS